MYKIATFARSGQLQAIVTLSSLLLASIILPPLVWLSVAIIFYLGLDLNLIEISKVLLGSTIAAGIIIYVSGLSPLIILVFALFWVLLLPLLPIYKKYGLAITFEIIFFIGITVCLFFYATVDPIGFWENYFSTILSGIGGNKVDEIKLIEIFSNIYPTLTGLLIGSIVAGFTTSIIFAIFWQNKQLQKKIFWQNFLKIKYSKIAVFITIILTIATFLFSDVKLWQNMLYIAISLFMLQGISILHFYGQFKNLSSVWVTSFYIVLFLFFYPLVILVAVLGLTDYWVDYRSSLRRIS
ncbi:MAG: hypothetical protein DRQ51_06355 [Gammaproteobacteria bacterium]|nr:MAG: hypothetical protein DRQ51_06355 [Gammaproteobacteria bacterium]